MPVVRLPSDRYWVGDPAEVLTHASLVRLCAAAEGNHGLHGTLRSRPFFLARAPGGAGEYVDEAGRRYVVGEGASVVVLPADLIEKPAAASAGQPLRGSPECFCLGGRLHAGRLVLDLNAPVWA